MVEKGAKYQGVFRDQDADYLEGGKSCSLYIPPNIPAANFCSMTVYDAPTASLRHQSGL
ncbi:MAG: hypothetical protein ACHQWV_06710 [Nitrospirales bacterium]